MNPIYKLYEIKLTKEIKKKILPKHIAIIMDGNRRSARKINLPAKIGLIFGSRKA